MNDDFIVELQNMLIFNKFKQLHKNYKCNFYYQNDDDIYLICAFDENNKIIDFLYFDFDFCIFDNLNEYEYEIYNENTNEHEFITYNNNDDEFLNKCFTCNNEFFDYFHFEIEK